MKKQVIGLITLLSIFGVMLGIIIANGKYIFRSEPYISQTEVNELVDRTYDKAVKENSDSKLLDKIADLELNNIELNNKIVILNAENQKLSNTISEKETTIVELNAQINALNLQIAELEQNKTDNEAEIVALNSQVETLTDEKSELDTQVKLLEYQITQNNETIAEHEKTIAQLQSSIKTYEDYIAGLETENEVFAIFVVENEIFEIYKSTINGLAYLENEPETAENCTFNGWKVNGELVDLSTYKLTCNTTFEADLTYGYTVTFMVENESGEYEIYDTQTVSENETVTLPIEPSYYDSDYSFFGWSLDSVNVTNNIDTISITSDVTYYSIFKKQYLVKFIVDDIEYKTINVFENNCLSFIEDPVVEGGVFCGWYVSDISTLVDITKIQITEDIVFNAYLVPDYDGRVGEFDIECSDEGTNVSVSYEVKGYYIYLKIPAYHSVYLMEIKFLDPTYNTGWIISNEMSIFISSLRINYSEKIIYYSSFTCDKRINSWSWYFEDDYSLVLKFNLSVENAIFSSQNLENASLNHHGFHSYVYLPTDVNSDNFTFNFDNYVEQSEFFNFYLYNSSMIYDYKIPDIDIPEGYKVELYFYISNCSGLSGKSFSELTLIGLVGEIENYLLDLTSYDNVEVTEVYLIGRYVKL